MRLSVTRKPNRFNPDFRRVIIRFLENDLHQAKSIVDKIYSKTEEDAQAALTYTLREFTKRHRNTTRVFLRHFQKLRSKDSTKGWGLDEMSQTKQLLIGAYFSQEYSIESAAFFNPSMVESPDQTGLEEGCVRVIVSFRATGEGHISSIVFRLGVIDRNGDMTFETAGRYIEVADRITRNEYHKDAFCEKLREMKIDDPVISMVTDQLNETFIYGELRQAIEGALVMNNDPEERKKKMIEQIVWLAESHYEIVFSKDTHITERVIFPVSYTERNGIEDARFVRFTDDDGKVTYCATYTAYSGTAILPKLIETDDFYHFRIKPLHGEGAQNKNLALFPRKINGKFAMISRIDGINNYIGFSDNINVWEELTVLQKPKYFWEYVKVGNCGSPIETPQGWLVVTHGVGPLRQYSLGAILLDLNDPTKVIGRLAEPLLVPDNEEREGYVPNVVYSCGGMLHNDLLVLPYGMSDTASGIMTVKLDTLLAKLKER